MASKQWIYGRNPVLESLRSNQKVERIYLQSGIDPAFSSTLRKEVSQKNIVIQVVPKIKLDKLVRGNHQGVIAHMALIEFQEIEDVLPFLFEQGEIPLLLILDGITDVRNFGAIARSAEVLGANGIIIPMKGAAPLNEIAMKTSAGALNRIPVMRVKHIEKTINFLKLHGLRLYATGLERSDDISRVDLSGPLAIVMGAEDKGVSSRIGEVCDGIIKIPQIGQMNSLNVSVATGIVLYEIQRQKNFNE